MNPLVSYVRNGINVIANKEEKLLSSIVHRTKISDNEEPQNCLSETFKLSSINIQHLYNNIGMIDSYIDNNKVDFTGTGESFFMDENFNDFFVGNGMRNDNLVYDGHTIEITPQRIKYLHIFGCCEWGNYDG